MAGTRASAAAMTASSVPAAIHRSVVAQRGPLEVALVRVVRRLDVVFRLAMGQRRAKGHGCGYIGLLRGICLSRILLPGHRHADQARAEVGQFLLCGCRRLWKQ